MAHLEVCISSDNLAQMAANIRKVYQAGAQRIELCSAMELDGLTPEIEAVIIARRAFKNRVGLMVMIRPRPGDFYYDESDVALMMEQIQQVADAGANGVVFGALNKQNSAIAINTMKKLMSLCQHLGLQVGFHRAFDAVTDRKLALAQLIKLNINRVLTSGTAWREPSTALSGISALVKTISQAQQKIEIVIAGGINPLNARTIFDNVIQLNALISFHSYSSVLTNGEINQDTVKAILKID